MGKIKCTKCKNKKTQSDFYKNKNTDTGFDCMCKKCKDVYRKRYHRTKIGLISKIYYTQICSSKRRKHKPPRYSKQELIDFLMSKDIFHKLYDNWVKSNYNKMQIPSVDRHNDNKPYSLSNITVKTWIENKTKYHNDQINGINKSALKAVSQYDLNGNFIKKYYSAAQARRETGVGQHNIYFSRFRSNRRACGFIWIYDEDVL